MPRPLSPENAPNPPDTPELGAFSSGETEKGKGETSSPLYRTSSDAYLISSDQEETKLGKEGFPSDEEQTEKGKGEFSSDKEQTKIGKEAEEKGKEEKSPPRNERPAPVMRGRRTLPSSPVERARLEAQGGVQQNELNDRSTQVAFALLFVVPILIILMAVLLLLPFISRQMNDDDPSGVRIQPSANGQAPSR